MKGLIELSKYAGLREDIVQGTGGNTSVKLDENRMCVKASGYHLYDVSETDGISIVDYRKVCNLFEKKNESVIDETYGKKILEESVISGHRPSIETFFHALSYKYVLHTHPVVVNAVTCREDWMNLLSEMFPNALMIPYKTPGVELAKEYFEEYNKNAYKYNGIAFLQNHGVVVSADSVDMVIEKHEDILKKIEDYLCIDYSGYHQQTSLNRFFSDKVVIKVNDDEIINWLDMDKQYNSFAFCPDCVVFLGKSVLKLNDSFSAEEIDKYKAIYGEPVVICWQKAVYIISDTVKKAIDTQGILRFGCKVMKLNKGLNCNMLSKDEQNFLLGWEAEKYRQKL